MFSWLNAATRPLGLKWRSSVGFVTFVVGLGIATDILTYSIIIPIMPFRLEELGYKNVSSLVGWLLFAYSGALALATIPIAWFSERYNWRKSFLIFGLFLLLGTQVLLMEAPNYWTMCIARALQGMGSSIVWTVGLALLCDTAPDETVGRHLGFAMSGLSIGLMVGPPVGGALFNKFGFRAPFIFTIAVIVFDLIGRLLIIERVDAILWGFDPRILPKKTDEERIPATGVVAPTVERTETVDDAETAIVPLPLSLPAVLGKMGRSSRAMSAIFLVFVYGMIYSSQEPAVSLHLNAVWGLNSGKVGLVFLAAAAPSLFASSLAGWIVELWGTEWVMFGILICAVPWWLIVIIRNHLALFIVAYAFESFLTHGVAAPAAVELAEVSKSIEGVGYAHCYGAFNLAYGIGSSVGPVIGGLIYDHVKNGWSVISFIAVGTLVLAILLSVLFVGERPLAGRLLRRRRTMKAEVEKVPQTTNEK